eukprot:6732377-Prymnesium_polylepis.1
MCIRDRRARLRVAGHVGDRGAHAIVHERLLVHIGVEGWLRHGATARGAPGEPRSAGVVASQTASQTASRAAAPLTAGPSTPRAAAAPSPAATRARLAGPEQSAVQCSASPLPFRLGGRRRARTCPRTRLRPRHVAADRLRVEDERVDAPRQLAQDPRGAVARLDVLRVEDASVHHGPVLHRHDLHLAEDLLEGRVRVGEPHYVRVGLEHVDAELYGEPRRVVLAQVVEVEGEAPVQLHAETTVLGFGRLDARRPDTRERRQHRTQARARRGRVAQVEHMMEPQRVEL